MAKLGAVISEAIVHHYGGDEFLRRFWRCHGYGLAFIRHHDKRGGRFETRWRHWAASLAFMCVEGGKHSRKTPDELTALGDQAFTRYMHRRAPDICIVVSFLESNSPGFTPSESEQCRIV
jgi:hypothetical protein